MATSRRSYPILGRLNVKLIDATERPLKPVYLTLGFLEAGLQDQSEASQDQSEGGPGPVLGPDPGPVLGPDPGPDPVPVSEPV